MQSRGRGIGKREEDKRAIGVWCHRQKQPLELTAVMIFWADVGCPEPQPHPHRLSVSFPDAVPHIRHPAIRPTPSVSRTCTCKLSTEWQFSHTPSLDFKPPRHADDSPLLPIISKQPEHARAVMTAARRYIRILADHLRDLPLASIAIIILVCHATLPYPCPPICCASSK